MLSFAIAVLIWSLAWVNANGSIMRPPPQKDQQADVYINSTSMSDALFQDEWMNALHLDGKRYYKQIIDNPDFRKCRPSKYSVQKDAFSISQVTFQPEGTGLSVRLLTPTNFSHITLEGLLNALATAGVKDAHIDVLSPAMTTGENALAGVFPYFVTEEVERTRMDLAQTEMSWIVHLINHYHTDIDSVLRINKALAETKKSISGYKNMAGKMAIRHRLRTRWKLNDLPEMSAGDEENMVRWLDEYQESLANNDRHTQRVLDQIIKREREGNRHDRQHDESVDSE